MTRSTSLRLGAAAAALTLGTVLAACGSSGGDTASTDDSSTTTTEQSAATTSTTAADGGATTTSTAADGGGTTTTTTDNEGVDTETDKLDNLPDGDHYGYIAGLENATVEGQAVQVILFDKVDFLTGQEAIDAAAEDGVTLDTDYYVRNNNQTIRRMAVVPDATVTSLNGGSPDPVPSSVTEVADTDYLFKVNASTVRGITLLNSIEGVYLP